MNLRKLLIATFWCGTCLPLTAYGVSISGNLSCGISTAGLSGETLSNAQPSGSCSISQGADSVYIFGSASLSIVALAATVSPTPGPSLSAGGNLSESYTVTTAGTGAGYVVITDVLHNSFDSSGTYSADGLATIVVLDAADSWFFVNYSSQTNGGTYTEGFTLGSTLSIDMQAQVWNNGSLSDYAYDSITYQFYTADGTPVAAIIDGNAVPEPSSIVLLGSVVVGGLFWARKSRSLGV